jgi:hypothetical protein
MQKTTPRENNSATRNTSESYVEVMPQRSSNVMIARTQI